MEKTRREEEEEENASLGELTFSFPLSSRSSYEKKLERQSNHRFIAKIVVY